MSTKADIRSFANHFPPSYSEKWQRERLTGTVYVDWLKFVNSIRRHSVVEVTNLFLLAPTTGNPKDREAALKARLLELRLRFKHLGGKFVLIEAATDRRSDRPEEWDAMLIEARRLLGSSGRSKGTGRTGRPGELAKIAKARGIPIAELKAKCRAMWKSKGYKSRIAAATAISKFLGIVRSVGWCYANFRKPDDPEPDGV